MQHTVTFSMSRTELHHLTTRLAPRQAAHAERLAHQRRGGLRQLGTRGGVFPQKISNSERILLTVVYLSVSRRDQTREIRD